MSISAAASTLLPLAIPSPSQNVWHWGPVPIRAYALAIMTGIVIAIIIARRRWAQRGGDPDTVLEIAFWAVPFGILGGRLYHVISSPDAYFGVHGDPVRALYIWEGGLGIWGAIALGGVGAWIGARKQGVRFAVFADVVAPALLVAQAIGRIGNYFNQELFGGPTTLPWGLEISPTAPEFPPGYPPGTLFHPTFLYELLWDLAAAAFIIWLERRLRLGHGRVFWSYVMAYTAGRVWIEMLRIDPAHHFFGLRLNVWTSIVAFLGALVAFLVVGRRHPGRETTVLVEAPGDTAHEASDPEA
ncbi:prolipoprotein diacylglyceryl transferase [Isoptericola sp. b441]|uniref:Phosphatidylglycerol--prolipoprotein diacylglyceryl transferase n=1 Tax=Actinotalea lenta TaxID=3064654 RepID=A0ABT9DDZ6_9CELL|nr:MULTISPECIES: prolipoprotein diacylglyceryl transferase [unclassified Isoptericola]MDO8107578.1 prolipoprotein diacylglyceryl transferase [Isoptericola sp. b441]MDO8120762.1 prolipoprotein diacylglyceryl transferase [Isoptericola sp. b490]